MIREGDYRLALVLEETVLYYRVSDDAAMAAQLEHVLSVMRQPNVSLGIIPARACRTVWPLEAFYAFDDNQVAVETLTAEITLTTPGEISTYLRAFSELSRSAVRGAEARALIVKALDALG
ncbi:Scr1 family TA system antitoxin-like transcriptional regulator [Streptomyces sp. NPDC004976]